MAHAGNPTGLAQQAGASRPWKTLLAAIAVLAIGLALVIAVMFVNSRAVAPATGRDDGLIEAQRDATLISGGKASAAVPAVIDESYNTSEGVRGLAPVSDNSFTTVTGTRLDATWGGSRSQEIQSERTHGAP